jgi:type 2 lantibiotic biosynthesis protein LanM
MAEPEQELLSIAARAASLQERLSHAGRSSAAAPISLAGAARIERWAGALTRHDPLGFRNRLEWAGWCESDVRAAMEPPVVPPRPMPRWVRTLEAIVARARDLAGRASIVDHPDLTFPLDPGDPIPFEEVLLPIVLTARSMLRTRLGAQEGSTQSSQGRLFSQSAERDLERSLLLNLLTIAGRALDAEFCRFRPAGQTLLRVLIGPTGSTSSTSYHAFTRALLASGLLDLFRVYPVVARLLATAVEAWVEATAELRERLARDLADIERLLSDRVPGTVVGVRTGLSDPHRGGRTVALLTFESGFRVIYKPRNVGMEVSFNRVLEWCNQHDDGLPFRTLGVLSRQDHGWVEHVAHEPCEDEGAASRFYQRAGRLLCLVHVLRGTDCHWENVVASGEHPVLVDLEALLQHDPPTVGNGEHAPGAWLADEFHDSVVRTGLLPRWQFDGDGRIAYDVSGLGAVDLQESPRQVLRWASINRDDMHLLGMAEGLPRKDNAAVLRGRPLSPHDHVEEIVAGFSHMYRVLLAQRGPLLAPDGPMVPLASQPCRFLPRHTEVYSAVLHRALAPDALEDGAERSLVLDSLSRGLIADGQKPPAWPLLAWELAALEVMDIPYVEAVPDCRAIRLGPHTIVDAFFDESSYTRTVALVGSLDAADLDHQVAIIRGTLSARASSASFSEALASTAAPVAWPAHRCTPTLGREALVAAARDIASGIVSHAHRRRDGGLCWLSLGQAPNSDRYQLQPLGPGLFDGYSGVALFLAALDSVTRTDGRRDIVFDCLRPLCHALRSTAPAAAARFAREIGLGGATGLGSVIYCLTRTSRFLDAPGLLESASQAAAWISPELIAADRDLDVVSGSAGAILGLVCLHRETGAASPLEQAIECGRHLLRRRIPACHAGRAWKTRWPRPLTGFSHGAAGIAYALLRLYAVTGDRIWRDAAEEGICYERGTFSPAEGNWPDLRRADDADRAPSFMAGWCHGAPGVALARLGGLPSLDGREVRQEIDVALRTSRGVGMAGVDHLCCGNFGRVELLQVAAGRLSRRDLSEEAARQTEALVARAGPCGSYRLLPELPYDVFCPGFFHGTSGIGYQVLRTAFPELLPSVLLWE